MLLAILKLAAVFFVTGVLLTCVIAVAMALVLAIPKRMSDGRALALVQRLAPTDLGLDYQNISFDVIDQQTNKPLKIAAWWIPHPTSRGNCAILVHGYSDAKVGGIAWAPLLRSLGFSVLAIDLRAHGDSGGKFCSAGFWERHDLSQVIDQIRAQRPQDTQQVILFGVSLGAAVVAATAVGRTDLAAVICESPYSDFGTAAGYQASRMGLPGPWMQSLAVIVASSLAHCDYRQVRPTVTIPQIPCPLMVIASGDDPFLSEEDLQAVQKAVETRSPERGVTVYWRLEGVHHVIGLAVDPDVYRTRLKDFLSSALPNMPVV